MNRATVSAGLVSSLAAFAARSGLHQPDILREVGLTETDLRDQDGRIGRSRFDVSARFPLWWGAAKGRQLVLPWRVVSERLIDERRGCPTPMTEQVEAAKRKCQWESDGSTRMPTTRYWAP